MPQSTVLGPLLFDSDINDIKKRISHECTLVQYADEYMIFASCLASNDAFNQLQSSSFKLTYFCRKSVEFECIEIRIYNISFKK